jgi:hypothetical protein
MRNTSTSGKCMMTIVVAVFLASCATFDRGTVNRRVTFPLQPLPGHPGNVFLEGEEIRIPLPETLTAAPAAYAIVDDGDALLRTGAWRADASSLLLQTLPVGWYRLRFLDAEEIPLGWTSFAVLAELKAPTPTDSPVSLDTAAAWFARDDGERQKRFMSLAALAGSNWVRDRLTWATLEPEQGVFNENETTYDSSAKAANASGLQVLQVIHQTPPWATGAAKDTTRFPRDLRTIHRFFRAMAARFEGQVAAWEPWNEPNIRNFGGHTINEISSLQKAAYLGLKAGDPNLTVGWSVFAGMGTELETDGVIHNEAWPYFDTFNVHSYRAVDQYAERMKNASRAACGKPIWLTECGIRLETEEEAPWGDLDGAKELEQAAFVAKSYAASIFSGVENHFFFILGNYIERGIQFGLLRQDLTPRPGYVAFAAVGRLLADAKPLGRIHGDQKAYAFRSKPDGIDSDVLVLWAEESSPFPPQLPAPRQVYDYLGRKIQAPVQVTSEPIFAVFERDALRDMPLEEPPSPARLRVGTASPIVLQVDFPREATLLDLQAYGITPDAPHEIPVWVYNFGDETVTGAVTIEEAPENWAIELADVECTLQPYERKDLTLNLSLPSGGDSVLQSKRIKLRGNFGASGAPVVSFRLCADRDKLTPKSQQAIDGAKCAEQWRNNSSADSTMQRRALSGDWVEFTAKFGVGEGWAFPKYELAQQERPSPDCNALAFDLHATEGEGKLRVQFREESGAMYCVDIKGPIEEGPFRATVFFDQAWWGSYSKADPNGQLDPEQIVEILIGVSARPNTEACFAVKNLAWLDY